MTSTTIDSVLGEVGNSSPDLRHAVEDFLYMEADLLDTWKLNDWLELWTDELTYLIPATDKPDGDPMKDLFLVQDHRFILEQRVESIMSGTAWAESPQGTLRRVISNVRASHIGDGAVEVKANFIVHRSQASTLNIFPGHLDYLLEVHDGSFKIRTKKATLDIDALRPQGRVAFIL